MPCLTGHGPMPVNTIGPHSEVDALPELLEIDMKWRTGRRNCRIIYAQSGETPTDNDQMIGVMDTVELARMVVTNHNVHIHKYRAK
jgi:hypothetical protein